MTGAIGAFARTQIYWTIVSVDTWVWVLGEALWMEDERAYDRTAADIRAIVSGSAHGVGRGGWP
jgi:hypothetical protein